MSRPEATPPIRIRYAFYSFILPGLGQLFQKRIGTAIRFLGLYILTAAPLLAMMVRHIDGQPLYYPLMFLGAWLAAVFCLFPLVLVMIYSILDTAFWQQGTSTAIPKSFIVIVIAYFFLCIPLALLGHDEEAVQKMLCSNNMKIIAKGCYDYNNVNGHWPNGYSVDNQGKPLHSWRVLILPHIGETELYKQIRLDEPWDSEYNRQFHSRAPHVYQCPAHRLGKVPQGCFYSMITDAKSTIGLLPQGITMNDIILAERKVPVN